MKNKILSITLVSMLAFTMIGCGSDDTSAATAEVNISEVMATFVDAQVEGESVPTMELDADMIEMLYGITPEMYVTIEARTPMMSAQCDEYVFVEVAEGQLDAVVAAFEGRQAYLVDPMNMGYPEHIEYANNYKLDVYGDKYVVFAIGMSAEDITAHFAGFAE